MVFVVEAFFNCISNQSGLTHAAPLKTPYVGANGIRPHWISVSVRKSCKYDYWTINQSAERMFYRYFLRIGRKSDNLMVGVYWYL
ncbi:MAG: hypothetical protein F6K35_23270 [Okeania sp. SIO2H7]|nr:hypothetical protein [Okeania sp. SIO2H7]